MPADTFATAIAAELATAASVVAGTTTFATYGGTPVTKGAALTPQLTTITIADAAGTPDYALQALTTSSPYGLATQAEAISLLYVIQNLQVRVAQIEARLKTTGGIAVIADA